MAEAEETKTAAEEAANNAYLEQETQRTATHEENLATAATAKETCHTDANNWYSEEETSCNSNTEWHDANGQ